MINRYGAERVRRGLRNFLMGKGFSSVAGFAAMLLVVRALSPTEFAAYSVMIALVEIIGAVSGLGIPQIILRYVPELYQKSHDRSLHRLIVWAVLSRFIALLVLTLMVHGAATQLAPSLGLQEFIPEFQFFMFLVFFRSLTAFLSQILDSTLHQGSAQFAFSFAALSRILGLTLLLFQDEATLSAIILVEAASDLAGALMMLIGIFRAILLQPSIAHAGAVDPGLKSRARKMLRFGLSGYLQHLSLLPYGSHTNRLLGGGLLSTTAMASFGFAQALILYFRNYLPAQLISGLLRPILIARYARTSDFSAAARLCELSLKINILLLGFVFVGASVAGEQLLLFVSADKYGFSALLVFLALLVTLILEVQRQQLDLLCMTVERYAILVPSNLLLSSSVVLTFFLAPTFAALAFPLANSIGLIASNGLVQSRLGAAGFIFKHDWGFTTRVVLTVLFSIAVGLGLQALGVIWWLAMILALILHGLIQLSVNFDCVFEFVRELSEEPVLGVPKVDIGPESCATKIAFGVLSSRDSAAAIDQIARTVAPHPLYVHHDFSKHQNFFPREANVTVLMHPVQTAWGDWSLVEASFLLMQEALKDTEVTHFQLLSESCLPVRPVREFAAYLNSTRADVMIDMLPLAEHEAFFSHGWRYCSKTPSVRRIARKLTVMLWGDNPTSRVRSSVNLNLAAPRKSIIGRFSAMMASFVLRQFSRYTPGVDITSGVESLAIGGQWFAVSRKAMNWLLSARETYSSFTERYRRCHIPDESYIHSLVRYSTIREVGFIVLPSNHALFWDAAGTGPDLLNETDENRIRASGKFFARKFSLSEKCTLRSRFS